MADPWLSGEDRENLDRKFQHIRPIRTIRQSIPVFTEFLKKKKNRLDAFQRRSHKQVHDYGITRNMA